MTEGKVGQKWTTPQGVEPRGLLVPLVADNHQLNTLKNEKDRACG